MTFWLRRARSIHISHALNGKENLHIYYAFLHVVDVVLGYYEGGEFDLLINNSSANNNANIIPKNEDATSQIFSQLFKVYMSHPWMGTCVFLVSPLDKKRVYPIRFDDRLMGNYGYSAYP
jgi:hypothetical protein